MTRPASLLLAALAGGLSASAHSFVSNVNVNQLEYNGFSPVTLDDGPTVIGWSTMALDQGYVNQTGYATDEIICHRGAKNAHAHAVVNAGDTLHIQWNGWPGSHQGPILDYLASCGESCETADRAKLAFFKINQVGLVDGSEAPGLWATDQLIQNNNSWLVEIPKLVQPGFYVLRHELIALHNASQPVGAQNYPQCFNLQIKGSGTVLPAGVPATQLYDPDSPSLNLDIYAGVSKYDIPGPALALTEGPVTPLSHPVPTGPGVPVAAPETTSRGIMSRSFRRHRWMP